jgi:transcription elongation factor Elf1
MCDICGRSSCTESFHSLEEQERYSKVIEAFERARELRAQLRQEIQDEAAAKAVESESEEQESEQA